MVCAAALVGDADAVAKSLIAHAQSWRQSSARRRALGTGSFSSPRRQRPWLQVRTQWREQSAARPQADLRLKP